MSTQHPDNVNSPFFAAGPVLDGEDEIQEAYYTLSHLSCDEQMWDCEGKEADDFVVKKLLSKYAPFFREHKLGEQVFLTLRVPNPEIEKAEAKVLLETLESIPRSFDVAKLFYGDGAPPIFEVIMPMTTSAACLERVRRYYGDFVIGKQDRCVCQDDITLRAWLGEFKPGEINVIPLFEDKERLLSAHEITREYLEGKDFGHQRVFLARSDPAMNYGFFSAVLLNKLALFNLHSLSEETGVKIYPIVGVGSAPFRGNLKPETVERVSKEYSGAHTLTVQSAFKYDNPPEDVRKGVKKICERKAGKPFAPEEEKCLRVIEKYSEAYRKEVSALAPLINRVAMFVPSRRKRKLHIGLFGYSRSMGGVSLPRVITFTAALYSVGLPPELLGVSALSDADMDVVRDAYPGVDADLSDALEYFNPETGFAPEGIAGKVAELSLDFAKSEEHAEITSRIAGALRRNEVEGVTHNVLRAASIRRFLG
ncbi:MAG: phosphoenolpyruvate carboxylase [Candidatus ainarchaeum sp.]|nr:phosphoenolpyruvate carboxylase [Candidatus ainarchaeum sp.]